MQSTTFNVARSFVSQFYQHMSSSPMQLVHFFGDSSYFTYCHDRNERLNAHGLNDITSTLTNMNLAPCVINLVDGTVDIQTSINDTIVIAVSASLTIEEKQQTVAFSHTFVLNKLDGKYACINCIWRHKSAISQAVDHQPRPESKKPIVRSEAKVDQPKSEPVQPHFDAKKSFSSSLSSKRAEDHHHDDDIKAKPTTSQPRSRIFISRLSKDDTEADIRALFEQFGPVVSVKLLGDRAIGFVEFADNKHCQEALKSDVVYEDRVIHVEPANDDRKSTSSSGARRRRGGGRGGGGHSEK